MDFESAYEKFVKFHIKHRSGIEAERIIAGLEHAEKLFLKNVWWPAFHHFDALHPQYKIYDFRDGNRYIDFAYIHTFFRIAIEIDGISPHWRDISQSQISDHCLRQNHLVIDGWHVLRFPYCDVNEHPRLCQQILQQLIGKLTGDSRGILHTLDVTDREIIRLAMGSNHPITANDVSSHVHLSSNAATRHLKCLTDTKWLEPASGKMRIRSYRIHPSKTNLHL